MGTRFVVHYADFPWCGDPIYRLTSMANIQAAAQAAGGLCPHIEVLRFDATSMSVSVDLNRDALKMCADAVG